MNKMFYQNQIIKFNNLISLDQHHVKLLIRTKRYIDIHYFEDINLDLLSKTQGLSKYHLLRLFKSLYGTTPRQYLIDKRLQKSKENLQKGMSVTDSCYAVGFYSTTTFSSLFKKKIGVSPNEYKKSNY
ncbi:MAG: AraC family transcriptional regulator [Flavobacteriales bacterium]|nr:AraC family transcriptional regulator [Flavobacteriales bacterium]|tara:strand:- start:1393 stop:1776 length:384 start_codon:yes stop_codon:yes gene_type:complete